MQQRIADVRHLDGTSTFTVTNPLRKLTVSTSDDIGAPVFFAAASPAGNVGVALSRDEAIALMEFLSHVTM